MKIVETELPDAFLIQPDLLEDDRGFFTRIFCVDEFKKHGLCTEFCQNSISFNLKKGTIRGLHFQAPPYEEVKLVRCTRGAIFDVIVDVRPGSLQFGHCFNVTLSSENRNTLYVPKGFAHGFQTLEDNSEIFYQISTPYVPEFATGINYLDCSLGIVWPLTVAAISDRDTNFCGFEDFARKRRESGVLSTSSS